MANMKQGNRGRVPRRVPARAAVARAHPPDARTEISRTTTTSKPLGGNTLRIESGISTTSTVSTWNSRVYPRRIPDGYGLRVVGYAPVWDSARTTYVIVPFEHVFIVAFSLPKLCKDNNVTLE